MKYKVLMSLMVIALLFIPLSCAQPPESAQESPQDWVVANESEFLSKCEHCNLSFEKHEFSDGNVYYYQRMIGNATVLGDSLNYQFDKDGNFEKKLVHWRNDLPDTLPEVISKEEAMTIGGGTKAELLYIDSGDPVFPTIETTDPCWAVSIYKTEYYPETNDTFTYNSDVIVVDAVTGEILGHGVPIP